MPLSIHSIGLYRNILGIESMTKLTRGGVRGDGRNVKIEAEDSLTKVLKYAYLSEMGVRGHIQ